MPGPKDVIPLSRFTAALARPRGTRRMEAILADKRAALRVAEMPVQDLYFLIKEVGLTDAQELVELATADQIQGFLDLEAWRRDELEPSAAKPWLEALVEAGPAKVTEAWRGLDPELAALLMARWTRVYNVKEEEIPEDEQPPFFATPDTFFLVKITAEDADTARVVERTLDAMYREDAELARHILRAAGSETVAYLEETASQFRAGRLQDLGYVDYYEALAVYQPLSLDALSVGEGTSDQPIASQTLPAPLVDATLRRGFLGEVLAQITEPDEAQRLETALVTLLNRVLSADRVPPGDPQLAAEGAARGAATLSLGLEAVARGDLDIALRALATISLVRLHRAGATVTLKLAEAARLLEPFAGRADEPYAAVLAALKSRRPSFARLLDDPPAAGERPFANLAEVAQITNLLGELASQARFVSHLGVDLASLASQVTLGDLGRTAVVRAAIGLGTPFAPISVADVAEVILRAFEGGRFKAAVRETVLSAYPREYEPTLVGWMSDLERELGRLRPSVPLDRRFLAGLVLE